MKGKILLIDDDDNVRDTLRMFLEEIGCRVIDTSNGTMALPLIREHRPDLVICDLVMPQLSGIMILRQIKQEYPGQKVIVMSGLQEGGASDEAKQLGALEYLTKPLSMKMLEQTLGKYLP